MWFAGRITELLMKCAAFALCLEPFTLLNAAEPWIYVRTPNFELYTSCSEKQAVQTLKTFEWVRLFFLQNSAGENLPEAPVRIIAFQSEAEFSSYRLNNNSIAYYQRNRHRDYIVLQDLTPAH